MSTTVDPSRAISIAPDGNTYNIPTAAEIDASFAEIARRSEQFRKNGASIVAVQGLGFVGSAVAAVIASARSPQGNPRHFVLGTDLATPHGYWKIAKINEAAVPIPSPDAELTELIELGVNKAGNLVATASSEAYALADTIVVDLPLDVTERFAESVEMIDVRLQPFERALVAIAERMKPDALILIETTVPIGVCENIALPLLRKVRESRGITTPVRLAHAYERVMPGPRYVDSIKRFWRTFSGIDDESTRLAREFLSTYIDTENFPLRELPNTASSELAKVLENSYRAVNIAFMYEWTLLAERIGINLFDVVESIRVRKGTHDNMRFPGFGIGGYCLTKDSLLAQWSATSLYKTDVTLNMTLDALRINHAMPLHTLDLARELANGTFKDSHLVIAGVSYLAEVADTRNSPTEVVVDALVRSGDSFTVTDPYLTHWEERPYIPVAESLADVARDARGIIFAVPHRAYKVLTATQIRKLAPNLQYIVDAFDIIDDQTAAELHGNGIRVAGVGKGHWRTLGYHA